ncbi:hypothetical protein AB0G67_46220 [Streptomyces sp. NPDC021056]
MWAAVDARLCGQHPADLPTSADLALRVEDLALALAGLARPHARTRKDA